MGQEPTFLLYAATVTSSIRPIEGSRCSARMLVGKLQGRPTAAREPRLLASLIGRIISADGRIEGGYGIIAASDVRMSVTRDSRSCSSASSNPSNYRGLKAGCPIVVRLENFEP